jgi:hypothetical protein
VQPLIAALEASNGAPWIARYEPDTSVERLGFVASAGEKVEVLQ